MSKEIAPAYQFYAAEYLADENVQLMTMEDEGCYARLMAYCWREGSIPKDISALTRLCKGTVPSALVLERFDYPCDDSTRLMHPRLEIEREKKEDWRKKCAKGGKASAHKPKHRKKISAEQGSATTLPRVVEVNGNTSSSTSSSTSNVNPNGFTSSVRSDSESESSEPIKISFPLADKSEFQMKATELAELSKLYPGVDPEQELLKAKGWLIANPTRRKTRRGIARFLHGWLSRAQDRGNGHGANKPQQEDILDKMLREAEEEDRGKSGSNQVC